jgi:hypothetical protein
MIKRLSFGWRMKIVGVKLARDHSIAPPQQWRTARESGQERKIEMQTVKFEPARNGGVMAKWEGKIAFPAKGEAQPEAGETWEVLSVRPNPAGSVFFLSLGKKIEDVFQSSIVLPDGREVVVSLSLKESWQTREGLRIRASLQFPEKKGERLPPVSIKVKEATSTRWHQSSVDTRDTPLGMWGWNLELGEQAANQVAIFKSALDEASTLALFELDIQSLRWTRVQ